MKYSEKKAAQIAAFFIYRNGGQAEILKLIKLMYFAERQSFKEYGEPMTGDTYFSLPHGPILSTTLDHINNLVESGPGGWEHWIQDRDNHFLSIRYDGNPIESLTILSDADLEVLETTWQKYGHYSASQLRQLSHQLEEWEDPEGSRIPISYERILKCVGHKDPDVVKEILDRIRAQSQIDSLLGR